MRQTSHHLKPNLNPRSQMVASALAPRRKRSDSGSNWLVGVKNPRLLALAKTN